jgi:hypothetical protein
MILAQVHFVSFTFQEKVSVVMLSEGYLKYGFIIRGNDVRTLIVDHLGVLKFLQQRLKSVRIKKAHKTRA